MNILNKNILNTLKSIDKYICNLKQDNKSFNGALRDVAVDTLRKLGHTVEVSDLYSNHFESRATRNDIRGKPFVF
jgi:putative NADPH-quinone reductase